MAGHRGDPLPGLPSTRLAPSQRHAQFRDSLPRDSTPSSATITTPVIATCRCSAQRGLLCSSRVTATRSNLLWLTPAPSLRPDSSLRTETPRASTRRNCLGSDRVFAVPPGSTLITSGRRSLLCSAPLYVDHHGSTPTTPDFAMRFHATMLTSTPTTHFTSMLVIVKHCLADTASLPCSPSLKPVLRRRRLPSHRGSQYRWSNRRQPRIAPLRHSIPPVTTPRRHLSSSLRVEKQVIAQHPCATNAARFRSTPFCATPFVPPQRHRLFSNRRHAAPCGSTHVNADFSCPFGSSPCDSSWLYSTLRLAAIANHRVAQRPVPPRGCAHQLVSARRRRLSSCRHDAMLLSSTPSLPVPTRPCSSLPHPVPRTSAPSYRDHSIPIFSPLFDSVR